MRLILCKNLTISILDQFNVIKAIKSINMFVYFILISIHFDELALNKEIRTNNKHLNHNNNNNKKMLFHTILTMALMKHRNECPMGGAYDSNPFVT